MLTLYYFNYTLLCGNICLYVRDRECMCIIHIIVHDFSLLEECTEDTKIQQANQYLIAIIFYFDPLTKQLIGDLKKKLTRTISIIMFQA